LISNLDVSRLKWFNAFVAWARNVTATLSILNSFSSARSDARVGFILTTFELVGFATSFDRSGTCIQSYWLISVPQRVAVAPVFPPGIETTPFSLLRTQLPHTCT